MVRMTYYNITNITNANSIPELAIAANQTSGGIIFFFLLIFFWTMFFMAFRSNSNTSSSILAASALTFTISLAMYAAQLLSLKFVAITMLITLLSFGATFITER